MKLSHNMRKTYIASQSKYVRYKVKKLVRNSTVADEFHVYSHVKS